eukprot:TRINITY_DN3072_c4_g1_i12.p4 TRINITY_DN3072_c4_g1~~TRINITY_DN3072_c4_g1_i12.p4  ORF type:complete len:97 (+),score=11.26 TRINITY_DN3072_c4_g1_i12:1318-1608(+)
MGSKHPLIAALWRCTEVSPADRNRSRFRVWEPHSEREEEKGAEGAPFPLASLSLSQIVALKNPSEPPVAPVCRLAAGILAVLHHRSRSPRLEAAGL